MTGCSSSSSSSSQPNSLTNDLSAMIAARNKQDSLFAPPLQQPTPDKKK
jgi:hypothetical protein